MMENRYANPAPLGLMGFGMTTVLLNLHNIGLFPLNAMNLAMGIAYGGLAQIIAGIIEFKKGNTFGATAFSSYGLFWISKVLLIIFDKLGFVTTTDNLAIAAYLFIWGIFTLGLFFGTLKVSRALQFVFLSLVILFSLLAIGNASLNQTIIRIAGVEGVICGLSAMYLSFAEIINEMHGREVLPIGIIKKQ